MIVAVLEASAAVKRQIRAAGVHGVSNRKRFQTKSGRPEVSAVNEYREAARRFLRVIEQIDLFVCDSVDPWRSWCAISLAMGLTRTQCKSVTLMASELHISKQLLSKSLRRFLKMTGPAPSFRMNSELAVARYRECQRKENRKPR
jgi:hypothetical protein